RLEKKMRRRRENALNRGQSLGDKGRDVPKVASLDNHEQIVTAGHQVTGLDFGIFRDALGQPVKAAAALRGNLDLDDRTDDVSVELLLIEHSPIPKNYLV